ncbi:hypothetical protein BVRB_001200 [Beta vulgaris subsp. vulgaris]|uniref:Uncharacterized protein n=1 Tax=Beta vulgaris subsp. vulgaris TaxID=3555 RepID=A0A0J8DZA9_BETVV|nr:hypothetical protein BVRB_001200 [Beta vulgaris subsp. vulgaris]
MDLNLSPPASSPTQLGQDPPAQQHSGGLLSSLGFGAWAQRFLRAAASFCSSTIRSPVMVTQGLITSHEPMLSLGSPHVDGTLGTVGSQGWAMRAPPRPDEAGPSN